MKFQEKIYSCGPATIRNTLRAFGHRVSEGQIRTLCGTTPEEGTDSPEMIYGLRELGYTVNEYASMNKKAAWQWLHGCLIHGKAVILCVHAWEHWVVAVGSFGDRVTIIDSSNFEVNKAENGTHVWSKRYLMNRWWNARKSIEGEDRLYAMAIGKK